MSELRDRLREHEKKNDTVLICPVSNYRCRYCPLPLLGKCKKLETFLETGKWEEE